MRECENEQRDRRCEKNFMDYTKSDSACDFDGMGTVCSTNMAMNLTYGAEIRSSCMLTTDERNSFSSNVN